MRLSRDPNPCCNAEVNRGASRYFRLAVVAGSLSVAAAIALVAGAPAPGQQQTGPNKPYLTPGANGLPDANNQVKLGDQQAKEQSLGAANAERKKQLCDESAELLTLAMDLKAEVDKTNKDMLSLNVIRKADEIEKLAHNVKEKMKLTGGGS
jgi:hypothetical protein